MKKWFDIKDRAATETRAASAEVFIYSEIGDSWWNESVSAKGFIDQINALDVDEMKVRINSYGGSVSDGIAIHNAIKRHKAKVTTAVDGVAMSIASLIAMAGDEVEMAENALFMVHAPWTYADGNAVQLREIADQLDTWAAAMASSYASKTGKPYDECLALLTDGKDHYYTAAEALDEGFIDSISDALAIAASADKARAGLKQFFANAAAAASNPQEKSMTTPNNPSAASLAATPDAAAIAAAQAAAVKADQERRQNIRAAAAPFSGNEAVAKLARECEDDVNCSVAAAREKILAKLGEGSTSAAGGHVVTIEDERDKFRAAARSAVLARAGLAKDDTANHLRGYTLLELARASLRMSGINANNLGKMELVAAAFTHGTSDFPLLLANIAEKSMLKGYEEAEETFQRWTSIGQLPDFKIAKRVDLNTFPALDLVPEGGEYHEATIGERGEQIQLATYGKMFSITRQAIINDDLDAFSKVPRKMGRAAVRTVGNLVYAVLTGNPAMADGKALFHADHKNLLSAAAPSTAAIDAMRVKMGLQKLDDVPLNIRLQYLLVPLALEGTAKVCRESEFEVGGDNNKSTPNSVRGTFDVISDARLDANSATKWYGAASAAANDTIEVSYLDGVQTPTLEQQSGWSVDGVQFKVRLDAGVKALDFMTMARNG